VPVVLDASAYLAYTLDEPGADVVEAAMVDGAVMSAVNLAETLIVLLRKRVLPPGSLPVPLPGAFDVEVFTEADALVVGGLSHALVGSGLSLADRACLALGFRLNLPVLTSDRVWADLDPALTGVQVLLIRP
jgi:ribonuclease VapC